MRETIKIAILNQKGGSGKTPVTINLAGALAELDAGYRVLAVDLDGQGDLTTGVGFDDQVYDAAGDSIYTLITKWEGKLSTIIQPAPYDKFDVLPGHIHMYLADKALAAERNREMRLARVFEELEGQYDFVLVDCPPNLGTVTDNALLACLRVLVPCRMNTKNERAVGILLDQVETLEAEFRVNIQRVGIVPVAYRPDRDQTTILKALSDGASFVAPVIRRRETVVDEAWETGRSLFSYQPTISYRRQAQKDAQADYLALARFVIERTSDE